MQGVLSRRTVVHTVALAALLLLITGRPALAAVTININTTVDENGTGANCSLREAISSANTNTNTGGCTGSGGGNPFTINVPAGTYDLSAGEIQARHLSTGSWYAYRDRTVRAHRRYSYKLRILHVEGSVEWAGPIAAGTQTIRGRVPNGLTPSAAKAAFGRFIHQRYPSAQGYWTCPAAQNFACLGEASVAKKRHRISATAKASGNAIVFVNVGDRSWVRRWSAYSKEVIRGFNSPGSASVNSPYFDWAFLAAQAYEAWQKHRKSFHAGAFDGPGTGWQVFYDFSCKTQSGLIRCTNALGDSIRYSPTGEPGR